MTTSPLPLQSVACNLCGADDTRVLFRQKDGLTNYPKPFAVVRCRRCGLVYVNPRPRAEDIGRFYTPEFVSYQFESAVPADRATWQDRLVAKMTHGLVVQRMRKIRRWLRPNPGLRVLDIGCGRGHFLDRLKREAGCEVGGLDIDDASVRYCRDVLGIPVIHGDMTALEAKADQYDLVTMWHFLEHEVDPSGTLAKVRHCLKPGGLLFIEVPNQASVENRVFGRRSYLYDAPRHLFDFSPATLTALLTKAGFVVEHVGCTPGAGGWLGSAQEVFTGGRVYRNLRANVGWQILFWLLFGPADYLCSLTTADSIMNAAARKKA